MKKVYVIPPLVGLLIFSAIYWNFSRGAAERARQEEVQVQEARKARILREAEVAPEGH